MSVLHLDLADGLIEWCADNRMQVRLLKRAVTVHLKRKAAGNYAKMREGKVPWKRISAWIKDNGGSYLFAPATCARKWDEVEGN